MSVQVGVDRLCLDRADLVRGRRVGLIAHPASVGASLSHTVELLRHVAGAKVVRVFAPEHGTGGGHQDMAGVCETYDPLLDAPVVSLYGDDEASLSLPRAALDGVDVLIADLMDVGARYYTFYATIVRAMPACAAAGVPLIICDRPNPLGGQVEGGAIRDGYHSFVGELNVAQRHGLTVGELCVMARTQQSLALQLEVIQCQNWRRSQWWDQTGLPWIPPSPNMPTLDTAIVYPGGCLIEGTNLSEGRGTTRPFELIGAPWLSASRLAGALEALQLPGVRFRPVRFLPAFQKHRGSDCHGVFIHVTDRHSFRSLVTGLAVIIAARDQSPHDFSWRREAYEFRTDPPAIDLLAGNPDWRDMIEAGASARELEQGWQAEQSQFEDARRAFFLYPE
ncbi:MAG: DUF1343 domain-containing protein [Acidobacteriota bacterium]